MHKKAEGACRLPVLRTLKHKTGFEKGTVCHYWCERSDDFLIQNNNFFSWMYRGARGEVSLESNKKWNVLACSRLFTRLMRLDKGSAVFVGDYLVIIYMHSVYRVDLSSGKVEKTLSLEFRNPLYGGLLVSSDNVLYFGEYDANWGGASVRIYYSRDSGKSWNIFYEFPAGEIFHVHSVQEDPYTGALWVTTGDFDGECKIVQLDSDANVLSIVGDGSQLYRAVSLLFYKDCIIWGMDSPLEKSCLVRYDRGTKKTSILREIEGTAWFSCKFDDGSALIQTTAEKGNHGSNGSDRAGIYYSMDSVNWFCIKTWLKDIYPNKYFRHGVVSFAAGDKTKEAFIMQGECLKNFDGEIFVFSIE